METQFFASLNRFCAHYQFDLPDTGGLNFPQNIYRAWEEVSMNFGRKFTGQSCIILQDQKKAAVLATVQTLNLNNCLFYIPVRPYWRMTQKPEMKRVAEQVLVLFAYLHQQAGIPYYMDSYSFMDEQYTRLEEWISESAFEDGDNGEEQAWRKQQQDDIYALRQTGAQLHRIIDNPEVLKLMEAAVLNFKPENAEEIPWVQLGGRFLELYRAYPNRAYADNIHTDLLYEEEEERLHPEQYTSFYWSAYDNLADDLDSMLNADFQEIAVIDEPMYIHCFDEPVRPNEKPLDYEDRLLNLMEELRDLLNAYDHAEHHPTV